MYEEQVTQFYDVKYLNQDIQSIQQDIKSIKKNMKGWTKLFSQIMELSIQNSKQNQQNSYLLHEIIQKIGKNSCLNLSPIKKQTAKTEPDEFIKINSLEYPLDDQALKSENISRILNQGKKMSIMHLQGTPFDSAYESINREMQGCDDSMKTTKIYDELSKFALNNPLTDSQPQSLKNKIYQSTKQLQKADSHRSTSNDKENQFAKKMVSDQRKSRVSLKEPKLSTVIEESVINMSPYISQNFPKGLQISTPKNITNGLSVNSCSNKQTFLGFDFQQNFTSKTPTNNKPLNYFIENTNTNTQRSGSKSLYNNNNNNNIKQPQISFKQQFDLMSQRAKSYSEQNCKKQQKQPQESDNKQYENSQDLIRRTQIKKT